MYDWVLHVDTVYILICMHGIKFCGKNGIFLISIVQGAIINLFSAHSVLALRVSV